MRALRITFYSIVALVAIVLCEVIYQYLLVPRMKYHDQLPTSLKIISLLPLSVFPCLGMLCRTHKELISTALLSAVLRVIFEFIIVNRNWPGHFKSMAIEAPIHYATFGLLLLAIFYFALIFSGHFMKSLYQKC